MEPIRLFAFRGLVQRQDLPALNPGLRQDLPALNPGIPASGALQRFSRVVLAGRALALLEPNRPLPATRPPRQAKGGTNRWSRELAFAN